MTDNYSDKSSDGGERDRERRGNRDRSGSGRGGVIDGKDRNSRNKDGERDRSPRRKKSNRVFVSNIPYEYRWQELKDLFRQQVGEVSFVELFVDEDDKPRGCGIIEFANPDLAKEAVEKMHRYELKGRKLVVKEDNDVERDKFGRILPRGERGRRRDDRQSGGWGGGDIPSLVNGPPVGSQSKWGNTYGLSSQFLESLSINGPLVPRCFVANLDYKVDEKKLKEVFRLAGRVMSCEISTDKEGKSRGFGVVEFDHPVEAVQAISMLNNQMLYERRLSVRMDRVDKGDLFSKLPEGLKSVGMGLGANGVPLQDVSRNLPSLQQNPPQAAVNPLASAVNTPALAAAALVGNLIGQGGGGGDLASLTSPFSAAANALGSANPLAATLLGSAASQSLGGSGLNPISGNMGGRDFDSLSAALSGNAPFSGGSNPPPLGGDRRTGGGGGGSSNRPNSDTIVIKNLPPGTTWQMLREKCRDAGDVKFAEMRGKDTGVVQFSSQWDAQRAVNMLDGIRVDGRIIDVRYF